jgi:general secretion pathway protein H
MGKKVEQVRRLTSQAGPAETVRAVLRLTRFLRRTGSARGPSPMAAFAGKRCVAEDGFTLIEVVCIVAIISIIAAIMLPAIPRGTPRARIEAYALEVASLLKADRNAAMRRGIAIATEVDAGSRSVRSGVNGRRVRVPDDVVFETTLAARCNGSAAGNTIGFLASGMSCGGTIALTRQGVGFQVRVNWLTGGVEIAPINAL